MRVLLTGSSGQIGTNLALRLLSDGHKVWAVDKRPNTWTRDFEAHTLLQDLSGHYASFTGGINGVEYPPVDMVVHLAAHAKVHQLVREPQRAIENAMMTFNVLEYCRALDLPLVFSSTREVYGDVHRFEEYGESSADFAFTESPYSASKIASEAFIYSYAKCYGLRYLVFRFSNVYGRYDSDLARMERVIPLFIERLSSGAPITVYGGDEKVLDFTYIDDCVDGIVRGIVRLADGRVSNETINLAYGQGNTLVRAAELIARELDVEPEITRAPSLVGEVTHYVADIRKARALLGWEATTPLDEGIPRCVAWFRSWRADHPDDMPHSAPARAAAEPVFKPSAVSGARERGGALLVAIYGPTASGKSGVARALAERLGGEVVSADSAALYAGIPILTAAPPPPVRLVGVVALSERVSVGGYQRLAHAAIDEILARWARPRRRRRHRALPARGGALPAGAAARRRVSVKRERLGALYDALGPERAHALLAERDPAAAARMHANDRRRVVRALELAAQGASLAPDEDVLWSSERRLPTLLVGLELPAQALAPRIEARLDAMVEGGVADEAAAAWGAELSETARRVLGLEQFATLPLAEARAAVLAATLRLARYQRKWPAPAGGRRWARGRPTAGGDRR